MDNCIICQSKFSLQKFIVSDKAIALCVFCANDLFMQQAEKLTARDDHDATNMKKAGQKLRDQLNVYNKENYGKYPIDMYVEFFNYWGSPENKARPKKLVYQNEKSWNLAGRLATWYKNYQKDHPKAGEIASTGQVKSTKAYKPVDMTEDD